MAKDAFCLNLAGFVSINQALAPILALKEVDTGNFKKHQNKQRQEDF